MRALAVDGVTRVTVFTGGAHLLAVFAKETRRAELVTARPVPASVTGDAAALRHLTGLLTLAVPTPAVVTPPPKKNNNEELKKKQIAKIDGTFFCRCLTSLIWKRSPVPAVLPIIPGRTRLPAELPTVPGRARA